LAPNTVSHTWIIRNATSYALTFTQGSGANVIIAAGQAKIVSTDGAGSGAVVYECLEDLELGGTLTVGIDDTGQDVKFYGATSGNYLLWDESADSLLVNGDIDMVTNGNRIDLDTDNDTSIRASADDTITIEVGGSDLIALTTTSTFSCPVTVGVDDTGHDVKLFGATSGKYWLWDESADGVVQQGTLTVGVDDTGYDVKLFGATSGAYMLWDESADDLKLVGAAGFTVAGDIDVDGTANLDIVDIDGAVDMATTLTLAGNADFNGDLDVDGTSNLDVVDIDGAVDMASTLGVTGKITADAGIDIDNFNIDGTTIALSSGDMTLDVAGDIILDADGGDWKFSDGGTVIGTLENESNNFVITSHVDDADIILKGQDSTSEITALIFDMSAAGAATFSAGIGFNGDTAAANMLDDYEEGTFTPTWAVTGGGSVTGVTSTNLGRYTKVGRMCTISFYSVYVATTGTAPVTYNLTLPFTADANCVASGMASEFGQTGYGQKMWIDSGATVVHFQDYDGTPPPANAYMQGSITYQTA